MLLLEPCSASTDAAKLFHCLEKKEKLGSAGVIHHLQNTTEADKTERLMHICYRDPGVKTDLEFSP